MASQATRDRGLATPDGAPPKKRQVLSDLGAIIPEGVVEARRRAAVAQPAYLSLHRP